MRHWLGRLTLLVAPLGALEAGCSSTPKSGNAPSAAAIGDDSGIDAAATTPPSADAGGADDDAAPAPRQANLRVAHLSPDLPPLDVCVAPHGAATFQGPLMGQLASGGAASDAAAPGLLSGQVSAYVPLAPGQYDFRLVAAGAADCSTPLTGTGGGATADAGPGTPTTNLPALAVNTSWTLLVAGEAAPSAGDQGLTIVLLPDNAALAGGAASLRAIHARPDVPALDVGLGSFATRWVALFTGVGFASAAAQAGTCVGALDANGYLPIAPLSDQAMSARVSSDATGDAALAMSVTIAMGAVATVFAVGKAGNAAHPPALLVCVDNAPSGGLLSDCTGPQ